MTTSVLLATTGRPEMAERCVRELRATAPDAEIVAAIDADEDTQRLLGGLVDVIDYSATYRGCSAAWNDALAAASGDLLVLAADDLTWHPGWLEAATATMSRFPEGWGMVGFNDGHLDGNLSFSTHYMLHRRFIVEVLGGRIAWECYEHSYNDIEANQRARRAGRYAWCPDAHVHHVHWLFGDRPQDNTDTKNLPWHPESTNAYAAREAAGFPNDYPPVIK